jgi:hypothetical protein
MRDHRTKRLTAAATAVAVALLMAAPPLALGDRPSHIVDSKPMNLYAAPVPYAFANPAANVYRFEVHKNDFGWSGDSKNAKRRAELISSGDKYGSGENLWTSFSFVVGPSHDPFDGGSEQNFIHQWHSVDTTENRAPVVRVELVHGNLEIRTQSDASSKSVVRYRAVRPPDGEVHNVVISGLLGKSGHIKAWLDGTQIVNTDASIGYYNDDGGERDLAYPQWGLYQSNVDSPAVIYHANLAWGTTDLSARVDAPPAVATPPGGWV